MSGAILILNVGSSSIKAAAFRFDGRGAAATRALKAHFSGLGASPAFEIEVGGAARAVPVDAASGADHGAALRFSLGHIRDALRGERIAGVGHRIVHGGRDFAEPVRLTAENQSKLAELIPLAPGHQPHNLAGVRAAADVWPDAPQIACFDTAFHRTQPRVSQMFALPRRYFDEGVLRYGFHGLSYDYIANAARELIPDGERERMIVAHLGAGASMCAIKRGRSVATTMGFTALDGLPMGTRCGALDPGVILSFLTDRGMSADEVAACLYKQSGLLGLSGISGDMRDLEASDDPRAQEAIDYFVYHIAAEIGRLAAVLGGAQSIVFTAGIGENSALTRARVVERCAWLGLALDANANEGVGARRISAGAGAPSAWVIPTDEEKVIADAAAQLIASQ